MLSGHCKETMSFRNTLSPEKNSRAIGFEHSKSPFKLNCIFSPPDIFELKPTKLGHVITSKERSGVYLNVYCLKRGFWSHLTLFKVAASILGYTQMDKFRLDTCMHPPYTTFINFPGII